jgi:hypothetical protein
LELNRLGYLKKKGAGGVGLLIYFQIINIPYIMTQTRTRTSGGGLKLQLPPLHNTKELLFIILALETSHQQLASKVIDGAVEAEYYSLDNTFMR